MEKVHGVERTVGYCFHAHMAVCRAKVLLPGLKGGRLFTGVYGEALDQAVSYGGDVRVIFHYLG
eukprot:2620790-Ditylum_brightwellii.AAC.1